MSMKCPKCNSGLTAEDVNIAKGIALCKPCNEIIDLSLFVEEAADIPIVEKPLNTKLNEIISPNNVGFIIPALGLKGMTWFFLLFSAFWNGIIYTVLISSLGEGVRLPPNSNQRNRFLRGSLMLSIGLS